MANFKNILPVGSLDGILGGAQNKFEAVKNVLTGGGMVGGFSNAMKGFGFWFVIVF